MSSSTDSDRDWSSLSGDSTTSESPIVPGEISWEQIITEPGLLEAKKRGWKRIQLLRGMVKKIEQLYDTLDGPIQNPEMIRDALEVQLEGFNERNLLEAQCVYALDLDAILRSTDQDVFGRRGSGSKYLAKHLQSYTLSTKYENWAEFCRRCSDSTKDVADILKVVREHDITNCLRLPASPSIEDVDDLFNMTTQICWELVRQLGRSGSLIDLCQFSFDMGEILRGNIAVVAGRHVRSWQNRTDEERIRYAKTTYELAVLRTGTNHRSGAINEILGLLLFEHWQELLEKIAQLNQDLIRKVGEIAKLLEESGIDEPWEFEELVAAVLSFNTGMSGANSDDEGSSG